MQSDKLKRVYNERGIEKTKTKERKKKKKKQEKRAAHDG